MRDLFRQVGPTDWIVGTVTMLFILLAIMGYSKQPEPILPIEPPLPARQALKAIEWKTMLDGFVDTCINRGYSAIRLNFAHNADNNEQVIVTECLLPMKPGKPKRNGKSWTG